MTVEIVRIRKSHFQIIPFPSTTLLTMTLCQRLVGGTGSLSRVRTLGTSLVVGARARLDCSVVPWDKGARKRRMRWNDGIALLGINVG